MHPMWYIDVLIDATDYCMYFYPNSFITFSILINAVIIEFPCFDTLYYAVSPLLYLMVFNVLATGWVNGHLLCYF